MRKIKDVQSIGEEKGTADKETIGLWEREGGAW